MGLGQYVPLMTATDTSNGGIDRKLDELDEKLPEEARSTLEKLRPIVVKHGRLGTLSLLAGGWAILKGLASLRKSPGRALKQFGVGAAWIAIGRAQQQASDEDPKDALQEDVEGVAGGGVEMGDGSGDRDESDDDSGVIAETNTQGPRDFGDPDQGETPEDRAQGAGEEAEITGPTSGDAVPENTKEGGSEGHPADDVEMVDTDADDVNEGSLQTDEQEEDVASDEPDEDDEN